MIMKNNIKYFWKKKLGGIDMENVYLKVGVNVEVGYEVVEWI